MLNGVFSVSCIGFLALAACEAKNQGPTQTGGATSSGGQRSGGSGGGPGGTLGTGGVKGSGGIAATSGGAAGGGGATSRGGTAGPGGTLGPGGAGNGTGGVGAGGQASNGTGGSRPSAYRTWFRQRWNGNDRLGRSWLPCLQGILPRVFPGPPRRQLQLDRHERRQSRPAERGALGQGEPGLI